MNHVGRCRTAIIISVLLAFSVERVVIWNENTANGRNVRLSLRSGWRKIWRAMKRKGYVSRICWLEYRITNKGLESEFWYKVKNPTNYLKTPSTLKWHNIKGVQRSAGAAGVPDEPRLEANFHTSTPLLDIASSAIRNQQKSQNQLTVECIHECPACQGSSVMWCDVMDVAGWTTRAIDGLLMRCRMRWTSSNIIYCPTPCGTLSACSAMDKDKNAGLESCRYALRRGLDSKSLILRRNTLSSGG